MFPAPKFSSPFKARLPDFPPIVWVVLAGSFLLRTAAFMVWPFLAIILLRRFHLPPSEVGLIVGISAIVSSATALYLGNLSDRFGRRDVIVAGCIGNVAACVIFATADRVWLYALAAILVGLCRAAMDAPANGLIAENIQETRVRELAFHGRYFLANAGVAIGPLIGLTLGISTQQATFFVTAAAYAVYAAAILRAFRNLPHRPSGHARVAARFASALQTLRADHRFLLVIISTFLAYAAYAQVESTLVQYLNLDGGDAGVGIATAIFVTNGAVIILFQFPLLRLMRNQDLHIRIQAGLILFVAGFLACALLPVKTYPGWIAAVWVLSLGEAILFPTLNLQADRMAPAHLRGSYFGAISFSGLGFGAGPFVGGVLLQYAGGPLTFLITAAVTVLSGACYWQSHGMARGVAVGGSVLEATTPLEG